MPSRSGIWRLVTLLLAAALIGCASPGPSAPASGQTRPPMTALPTTAPPASPASTMSPPPSLPEPLDIESEGALPIRATSSTDWIVLVDGSAYVAGLGDGIGRLDPVGEPTGSAALAGWCEAMDVGFDAIWTATCEPSGLARIDPETLEVTSVQFDLPTEDSEGSVGAGEGAVWAMVGPEAGRMLVRVDPETLTASDIFPMPSGAGPVRAGLGAVWITNPTSDELHRVNPATGAVVTTIPVGPAPRFLAVGEGQVWVMNQADGSVSRVDPATNEVVATIDVGRPIEGGDIAVGGGSVWVRGGPELLARIDPATNEVTVRYRPPVGSGSVAADDDAVWVTAHDVLTIWRLPLD